VQQRDGVHLGRGLGKIGDVYERYADAGRNYISPTSVAASQSHVKVSRSAAAPPEALVLALAGEYMGPMYLQGNPQETIDVPVRSRREHLYSSKAEEASTHRVYSDTGSASITSGEAGTLEAYLIAVASEWD
jgi:hypothetical protein